MVASSTKMRIEKSWPKRKGVGGILLDENDDGDVKRLAKVSRALNLATVLCWGEFVLAGIWSGKVAVDKPLSSRNNLNDKRCSKILN